MKLILFIQTIVFILGAFSGKFSDIPTVYAVILSSSFLFTAYYFAHKNKTVYSRLIVFGMLFCFLGDLAQKNIIPGSPVSSVTLFGVAHILFIFGYVITIYISHGKIINKHSFAILMLYYLSYLIIWYFIFVKSNFITVNALWSFTKYVAVAFGSLAYGFLLSSMAFMGLALFLNNKTYLKTALGSFMFFVSDCVIAISHVYHFPYSGIIIWLTYLIALFGIIYGNNIID